MFQSKILSLLPRSSSAGGKTPEDQVKETATKLVDQIPPNFDIDKVLQTYSIKYEESMNTVLIQELIRYNRLITVVNTTLQNLINAIEGIVVMNPELDKVFNSVLNN